MYSQFAGSERRTGHVSRGSRDTPMELDKAAARGYRGTRSSVIGPSLGEGEAVRTRAAALDGTRRPARLIAPGVVDDLLAEAPPFGPAQEVRELVTGYVAGYNRYLSDVGGSSGVSDSTCRGKPWVRPITEADAYRRFYQLTELASADVVIDGIAEAAPPTPGLPEASASALSASLDPQAIAQGLS